MKRSGMEEKSGNSSAGEQGRKPGRAVFLEMMDAMIPWEVWVEEIRPYYPDGKRGRPTKGIEFMLRMYLLQNWFSLSDEGVEDELYDSISMRGFMGPELDEKGVPDATTLLKFRHLLEEHGPGKKIFDRINGILEEKGYLLRGGSILDATIIQAPSSTKNQRKKRDEEMHSTKKGNNFYFGMKCHIGVDAFSGLVHTIVATAANVADVSVAHELLRRDDEAAYGDNGYRGIENREEIRSNADLSKIAFRVNCRRGSLPKLPEDMTDWSREIERMLSAVRCKVEFPFRVLKCLFGFRKTVYRGIQKNENRLYVLFTSFNLYTLARAGRTLEKPAFC